MVALDEFTISKHATARILDMGIEPAVIRQALIAPEKVRPCRKYPEFILHDLGEVTLSIHKRDKCVATVLWRTSELWQKDLADGPAFPGRAFRPDPFQSLEEN